MPVIRTSVIITAHNRPDFLREALESIRGQTRPPHEMIVVDDGSTVDLSPALEGIKGVRLVRQENAGQQAARNHGSRLATGDWLLFLDDDDKYRPDHIETLARLLEVGSPDIIFSNFLRFSDEGVEEESMYARAPGFFSDREIESEAFVIRQGWPVANQLRFYLLYPSHTAISTKHFRAMGGFDERVRGVKCEDIEFSTRATNGAAVGFSLAPTVLYRMHPGNSVANPLKREVGRLAIWSWVLKSVDLSDAERAEVEAYIEDRALPAFRAAFLLRDRTAMAFARRRMKAGDWMGPKRIVRSLWAAARFREPTFLPKSALDILAAPGFTPFVDTPIGRAVAEA